MLSVYQSWRKHVEKFRYAAQRKKPLRKWEPERHVLGSNLTARGQHSNGHVERGLPSKLSGFFIDLDPEFCSVWI